ncbi:MAG: HEAT repeat domain-containing protein [Ktedonobacteraceae bacterium]
MADLPVFSQKVNEYLFDRGLTQRELAINIHLSHEEVNRRLNGTGKTAITCADVRSIIKGLARLDAITTRQQARELLDFMECGHFDPADWEAEPLNELKPDPPPSHYEQMDFFLFRRNYLEKLSWYSHFVTLPIAPNHAYPFKVIFQSLKLRQDPLAAEDLPFSERRALLDEPSRGEYDPRRILQKQEQKRGPGKGRDASHIVIADTLEDALKRSRDRVLVLGPPGSGKTTILKAFVNDIAQRALAHTSAMIPILIQLRWLTRTDYTLESSLRVMLGTLGIDPRYASALRNEIQHGRACLCIDGLDEIPPDQREMVISWISALAPERGNRWIISSRFADYHTGLFRQARCVEWELQPLSPAMRRALADGLIPEVQQQLHGSDSSTRRDAKTFSKTLERHPRIATWGKNPFLFSLTAVVFVATGTISTSRAALYNQVIEAILRTRQKDHSRQTHLRQAAASLALALFLKKQRTITYETLLDTLAEHSSSLKDSEELARDLVHAGLLEVVAEDTYGYWHYTYQEYFAAVALAKRLVSDDHTMREQTQQLIGEKRFEGQWLEVLRLLIGILLDKHDKQAEQIALEWLHRLIKPYTEPGGDDPGNLGLTLAIQSLGERGEASTRWNTMEWRHIEDVTAPAWVNALLDAATYKHEVRQERLVSIVDEIGHFSPPVVKSVQQQLTAMLLHQPAHTRAAIIRALGKFGKDAPMNILIQALGDKHAQVREAGVRALVELEEDVPLDSLVKSAFNSKCLAVRVAATHVLGELRQPSLLKSLLPGLRHEKWSIREATIVALGNLGEQASVRPLLNSLHDETSEVRQAAVVALGKLGGAGTDKHLVTVLENDRNDSVRAEVLKVLGKRVPVEDVIEEVLCPPHFVPYSLAYHAAAELLGEREEQEIRQTLTRVAGKKSQEIWDLIQAIRESQQEPSTEQLLVYLYGNDQQWCYAAANRLGHRDEWTILEHFVASLEQTRSGLLRAIAARLLGRLGAATPVHLLVTALTDTNPAVRLASVQAFEDMGEHTPPEAAAVIGLLNDPDQNIAIAAMHVVARIEAYLPVDVPLLETLLIAYESPYKAVARAAQTCLKRMERRVTPEQFTDLLHLERASVRLEAMKRFGKYIPIAQIANVLQDTDARIRFQALQEISNRDYAREVPLDLLAQLLQGENLLICQTAFHILWNRGERQLLTAYIDEEGVPFFPHLLTPASSSQHQEFPRPAKSWDDGMLMTLSMILGSDDDLRERHSPDPDEEFRPMDKAEKNAIRKRVPVEQLFAALEWPDARTRLQALQVLEKRTPEDRLIATLDDEDSVVRRKALQLLGEQTPTHLLGAALGDDDPFVRDVATALLRHRRVYVSENEMRALLESHIGIARASAIKALEDRLPRTMLIAALGDSEEAVRFAAFDVLIQTAPETLATLVPELIPTLTGIGTGSSDLLASAANSFLIDLMANMEDVPSPWLEKLSHLLGSSYWEVQMKVAQALGKLRRDIPQEGIDRLRTLRNDSASRAVQMAADDALAAILSFETSMEESL